MKRNHLFFAGGAVTAVAAAVCLLFSIHTESTEPPAQFNALTDTFFENEVCASTLNLHYTLADPSAYGIKDYPVVLGTLNHENAKEGQMLTENYLASLHSIDRSALNDSDRFTYDVLSYTLDLAREGIPWYYYQEPLSPTLGVQAQLPILLAEYAFYSEQDVLDYLGLLSQMGDYFTSITDFEKEKAARSLFMSDSIADEIMNQCVDFIGDTDDSYLKELFDEKIQELPGLSEEKQTDYIKKNEELLEKSIRPAYEKLVNTLSSLKGSGINNYGLCYFPKGASYYEYLVKSTTGSDRSVEKIQELLEQKRQSYSAEISALVSKHPSLLASMDFTVEAKTPDGILNTLKKNIRRDFPPLPQTDCTIKEVHPSLQDYSSPAFYLTPPIDRIAENVIYINPAGNYQGIDLFTTLAHEGYPGHLYQTVYSHANCPNPLAGILHVGGYTEGWATYAELYSYTLAGLDPSTARLLALNKAWTLNLYSTMDVGIHYYGWTVYDVYEFLNSCGIDNLSVSEEIYRAIVADPANYLKYYVGYLEFEALKTRAHTALGSNFCLRDFHEKLLTLGPAPFALLEKEMDAWIAGKD